jgi:hypothetical protein
MNATGIIFRYRNSVGRGMTFCAEVRFANGMYSVFGQKTMRGAIMAANKGMKKLGLKLVSAWRRL